MRKILGGLILISPLALLAACEAEDPGMQQDETAIQEEATLGDEQGMMGQEEDTATFDQDDQQY